MNFIDMMEILQDGGWVMILLAVLALILYVTAFDVLHFVYSGNLNGKSEFKWRDWVLHPDQSKGRVGEIIRYTQGGDLNAKRIEQRGGGGNAGLPGYGGGLARKRWLIEHEQSV